jgi:Membrane-bound metallopeptidase
MVVLFGCSDFIEENGTQISGKAANRSFESNKGMLSPIAGYQHKALLSKNQNRSIFRTACLPTQHVSYLCSSKVDIQCVGDGVIRNAATLNNGYVLIVQHGDYFTIYANLTQLYSKPGDAVRKGQILGVIEPGPESNELWFQVRHNQEPLNPLEWISRERTANTIN